MVDKKGAYKVKSGVNWLLPIEGEAGSGSKSDHKWWLNLWISYSPPKIKIFIWRNTLSALRPSKIKSISVSSLKVAWVPPPDSLKLNFDAVITKGVSYMGAGDVIRDSDGKVIAALREGLLLAKLQNLRVNWVEADAANIIAGVNSAIDWSYHK
ncbi:hypothetical protein Dsin_016959 [Dipteronia sinensis]|uniref:RNase H type-1 domain-containing protein n=1 Tax=Dipteronia sinensis TaxID=43782 RepID=A0AAE0AEX0_9ROSI|nr:hypothetical protein Dsin_016959 [Dipteronia sinensis]